jgi:hypothetical protein
MFTGAGAGDDGIFTGAGTGPEAGAGEFNPGNVSKAPILFYTHKIK